MGLRISGKNVDLGEALRGQVQARVAATLQKYFDGGFSGHVTMARDGSQYRTDCVLHLTSGITLEATGAAHDPYASFDRTAERLESRLRRYKGRLKAHAAGPAEAAEPLSSAYAVIEAPSDEAIEEAAEFHPVVIAESTRALHRLTVSQAVVELDLSGAPCVVFVHSGNGRVNVVYRRRDGAIGWVDPPAA